MVWRGLKEGWNGGGEWLKGRGKGFGKFYGKGVGVRGLKGVLMGLDWEGKGWKRKVLRV